MATMRTRNGLYVEVNDEFVVGDIITYNGTSLAYIFPAYSVSQNKTLFATISLPKSIPTELTTNCSVLGNCYVFTNNSTTPMETVLSSNLNVSVYEHARRTNCNLVTLQITKKDNTAFQLPFVGSAFCFVQMDVTFTFS